MDPATVAAAERPKDASKLWVAKTVVNQPALMVWAAYCDVGRRAQHTKRYNETSRTATLLGGHQLEPGATWKMQTVVMYRQARDRSGSRISYAEVNTKYTLVQSVPGKCAVFVYESLPDASPNYVTGASFLRPQRVATFFTELPDGRTEVTEEIYDPLHEQRANPVFWIVVLATFGCYLLLARAVVRDMRTAFENDLAVYKAHIESLDRAAWMAGVQADVDKAAKAAGTQSAQ